MSTDILTNLTVCNGSETTCHERLLAARSGQSDSILMQITCLSHLSVRIKILLYRGYKGEEVNYF